MSHKLNLKMQRYKTTEAELDLARNELHATELSSKDSTRGTCIYTLNTLQARKTLMPTEFKESTRIKILLENNCEHLVGCIYRSP